MNLSPSPLTRFPHGFFRPFAARGLAPVALVLAMLLGGCASHGGYLNHVQPDLAVEPAAPSEKNSKPMYLDLIRQMQQQGAYYASLANIDAYRQRYGDSPALRRLQADALRKTGQTDAARAIYQSLVHTDEAAAAWHGLGLAAAEQQRSAEAEQALARAVQLDPVNVDYLGDLGYQRLRAGAVASAHEPLAKAAELAPGNLKAVSNLVLWMLLDNDYAQADAAMQQANLPDAARQQVRTLAMQLRAPPQAARPRVVAALSVHAPAAAAAGGEAASRPTSADAGDGVPPSMLERFGTSSTNSEAHP